MKDIQPEFLEEVNVSKEHPLLDFFGILGVLILSCMLIFALFYGSTLYLVKNLSIPHETRLHKMLVNYIPSFQLDPKLSPDHPGYLELQKIVSQLQSHLNVPLSYDIKLFVKCSEEANAFAFPGGGLMLWSKVITQSKTENGLSMILAHELGHFQNRDHLRSMGIALPTAFFISILGYQNPAIHSTLNQLSHLFVSSHGRHRESQADLFGLKLLNQTYGHIGGYDEFFQYAALQEDSQLKWMSQWTRSHPYSDKRIFNLEKHIVENKFLKQQTMPLSPDILNWLKSCSI